MNFKVHNTAIIDKGAKIGKDSKSGIGLMYAPEQKLAGM